MKIDNFNQIEQKNGLYEDEIEGVNYWMYVRFDVWHYHICQKKLNLQKPHSVHNNKLEQIKSFIHMMNTYFVNNRKPQKESDICFIAHERRLKIEDVYQCLYTDKIAKEYPQSVVLEKPYQYSHLKPVSIKNIIYTDSIIIPSYVIYYLHQFCNTTLFRRLYKQVVLKLELSLQEIEIAYQINLKKEVIYKETVKKIILYKKQYNGYKTFIEKINPKIIVEVCYYNMQCMIINEIAKKLQIHSVELQHGTMNEVHCAYQFAKIHPLKQLPDQLFLFSDFWKSCIHFPLPDEKKIAVGFPYFESKLKEYHKKKKEKQNTISILFISQGIIGNELSLLATELRKKLDRKKYHIIYKLHPGEYAIWKSKYPWLLKSSIEIIDNLEHSLYDCFAVCDIQIGVNSTGIYEGIGFGLKTYLYDIGHRDIMDKLVELHYAQRIKQVDELAEQIMNGTADDRQEENIFWKEDAYHNMKWEIEKLMKSSEHK